MRSKESQQQYSLMSYEIKIKLQFVDCHSTFLQAIESYQLSSSLQPNDTTMLNQQRLNPVKIMSLQKTMAISF